MRTVRIEITGEITDAAANKIPIFRRELLEGIREGDAELIGKIIVDEIGLDGDISVHIRELDL